MARRPRHPHRLPRPTHDHRAAVHHRYLQRRHGRADRRSPRARYSGWCRPGTLTNFQTNETAYSCLNGASLNVYDNVNGKAVAEAVTPTNCIAQDFQLP